MKKILSIMLSISFALTLLFTLSGCNDTNSSLANNINQSVTKVKSVLEQTPEASNEELVFEEIMSLSVAKSSANASIISNSLKTNKPQSNKVYNGNKIKVEKLPMPNLTKQIVKKSNNSNLELIGNPVFGSAKPAQVNRLTSRRVSDTTRLTNSYYIPRKVSSVNYNNPSFVNYLGKIEDMYLMMNDAVCTNDNINSCKNSILECCDLLGLLSQQLKSKEIKLNDDQIKSCNELLNELGGYTNKVTSSRNDVKNNCSSLRQSSKDSSFKIDRISSNYVKLINCLDSRECYYDNMLSCMQQLQCLLAGNCYSDNLNLNEAKNLTKRSNTKITDIFNKTSKISNKLTKKSNIKITDIFKNKSDKTNIENINSKNIVKNDNTKNKTNLNKNVNNNKIANTKNNVVNNQNNQSILNKNRDIKNIIEQNKNKNNTTNNAIYGQNSETKNNATIEDKRNTNIDTYKEQTIKPNVIDSRRNVTQNQNNNQNLNNNQTQNNQNYNNSQNQNLNNNQNPINPIVPNNGVMPNTGVGVNLGIGVGGLGNPGVGVTPGIGGGVAGGVGYGVGTGLGGRYNGIHNYENGIINPYRNTDTYKLSSSNIEAPLPSETRRNFKPFTEINSEIKNENSLRKINSIEGKEIKAEINGDLKTSTKTFKVS